jgi:hypothetical protein
METENEKTKSKRGRTRRVVVVFKDTDSLDFVGVYLNEHHMEAHLDIWNGNISHYMKYKINTLNGYLPVEIEIGDKPLNMETILEEGRKHALNRFTQNALLKFNAKDISKLTPDQAKLIHEIMAEGIIENNNNSQKQDGSAQTEKTNGEVEK